MSFTESMDYWRLCEELNIVQAGLLISGNDPSGKNSSIEELDPPFRPPGYDAAKTAVGNALRKNIVKGMLIPIYEYDINGNQCGILDGTIDVALSTVDVESLRTWLVSRGVRTGFFFPEGADTPDYLDPQHPRYAPKLAAAVSAWVAVAVTAGKSPKQALEKWIRENAASFALSDEDGNPNNTGIEEVAKVANWQPGGGAPKTPNA